MDICFFISVLFLSRLVIINCGSVTVTPFCPPAEEGKEYTMTFKWTPPKERIFKVEIIREETAVASCSSLNMCTDYIPSLIQTTSTLNKTNSEITIFVQIFSMIRKSRETTHTHWYVSMQARDLTSCRVNFYTRINSMSCKQENDEDVLRVNCTSGVIFPAAQCRFMFNLDYMNDHIYGREVVFHSHEAISDDPVYYISTCVLNLPTQNLSSGLYELLVTMYPNATDNQSYIKFGANVSLSIKIEERSTHLFGIHLFSSVVLAVVVGNAFFVSIIFLYLYRKQRVKRKMEKSYDVINEIHSIAVPQHSTEKIMF